MRRSSGCIQAHRCQNQTGYVSRRGPVGKARSYGLGRGPMVGVGIESRWSDHRRWLRSAQQQSSQPVDVGGHSLVRAVQECHLMFRQAEDGACGQRFAASPGHQGGSIVGAMRRSAIADDDDVNVDSTRTLAGDESAGADGFVVGVRSDDQDRAVEQR